MVGIIPKPIKKPSQVYRLAPYIVFGLVAVVVLAYIVLSYLENNASKTMENLQERIAQVGTKDEKVLEAQVLLDKEKIDDFSKLFADHQRVSNFLKFLEENSHPEIWFNKLILNSEDSEVVLAGETANFETLGQQIVIFQSQELVKNVEISDLSLGKNGRATFTFTLSLDQEIFKNNE